jgi:FtsP/CotA-like multicopper oxidase with cupredoxin domain
MGGHDLFATQENTMVTRRTLLQTGVAAALAGTVPGQYFIRQAYGSPLALGLSDPALQPKFQELVPNALDPGFIFEPVPRGKMAGKYDISIREANHQTGLRRNGSGKRLNTRIFGYGYDDARGVTWPGRTFIEQSGSPTTVRWNNELGSRHLLPVDTTMHWCYSLHGYENYSIKNNGVPIITHLHGGHSDPVFDGNPEFFYSPDGDIVGPQWDNYGGLQRDFVYQNDQPAGNLWYHDHALGITRLNVYAGMAGFYFLRDAFDSGDGSNSLGLPYVVDADRQYELAYAIQDRMFNDDGSFFFPAFPGDPLYDDFITGEGVELPEDIFRKGGPTALAEFFGDHMVVNGKIWPKTDVEPRQYRIHILNGTDSRFMGIQFKVTDDLGETDPANAGVMPFYVIGSDQGLATQATQVDELIFEPGSRYDLIVDFRGLANKRVIMANTGGDAPFGGTLNDPTDFFPDRQTDRVMAFDVTRELSNVSDDWTAAGFANSLNPSNPNVATTRKVALFEGMDEFGRLQPLLGIVNGDNTATAYPWHLETTEKPAFGSTEEWEIYNFTGDAHPVHLHLVHFEQTGRNEITFDEDDPVPVLQHNGQYGEVAGISNVQVGAAVNIGSFDGDYVETTRKDMVTALPEQVTKVKATFDKRGRYVWHCHILSHEDHEMMRVLEVV